MVNEEFKNFVQGSKVSASRPRQTTADCLYDNLPSNVVSIARYVARTGHAKPSVLGVQESLGPNVSCDLKPACLCHVPVDDRAGALRRLIEDYELFEPYQRSLIIESLSPGIGRRKALTVDHLTVGEIKLLQDMLEEAGKELRPLARELAQAVLDDDARREKRWLHELFRARISSGAGEFTSLLRLWIERTPRFVAEDLDLLFKLALVQEGRHTGRRGNDEQGVKNGALQESVKIWGPQIDLYLMVGVSSLTNAVAQAFLEQERMQKERTEKLGSGNGNGDGHKAALLGGNKAAVNARKSRCPGPGGPYGHDPILFKRAVEIALSKVGLKGAEVVILRSREGDVLWNICYSSLPQSAA